MKLKRWKLLTVLIAAFVLVATVSVSVYAYFSTRVYVYTENGKEVAHLGMNLQLLFGKLKVETTDSDGNPVGGVKEGTSLEIPYYAKVNKNGEVLPYDQKQTADLLAQYPHNAKLKNPTFDPEAPWGSPQNPYIIANERHLQNLSALQNIGYFDMMYIEKNFDKSTTDGKTTYTYNDGISMPYFLICDENGAPVVIDATDIGEIKPVGSAEHPFIGVVGGAFASGDTYIDTNRNKEQDKGEKTTSVSTLHGVKVQTNTNQTDVGLFGYVGYLGDAPADGATEETTINGEKVQVLIDDFEGVVSILQNFTLSDVQIKVNQPSIPEQISQWIAHVFNDHRFTDRGYADDAGVPHEDHHIGILAGHVSYATVEYISVYYSRGDICAIDLLHTKNVKDETIPNYHSTTGILGFMHNMNSSVTNQTGTNGYTGHCLVSVGGTSSGGITLIPGGQGTGGGKEIGIGPGYVMAKTLYDGFHFVAENQSMYDRIWSFKDGTNTYYGMMYFQDANGNITSQNNNKVQIAENGIATETLSNGSTKAYKTYVIQTLETQTDGTVKEVYTLYNASTVGTVIDKSACDELPQSIWQYVAEKPVDEFGFAIEDRDLWEWTEAVLLVEQSNGSYTLTDGVTPVTVDGTTATISGALDASGNPATIERVFFLRKSGEYSLTATDDVVAPVAFREKPLLIQTAKNKYGTDLCEPATEGFTLSREQGYYFYDGVFTFALSSSKDTIEDLWENDTPDNIVLGPKEDASWEINTSKGNQIVIAYIKPITTPEQWAAVAASGQEIFIGYHGVYSDKGTDDNGKEIPDWTSEQVHLMTLAELSTTNNDAFGNDFFKTTANTKSFISSTDYDSLITGMENDELGVFPEGYSDEQKQALLNGIRNGDIQILNLESGDIEELQNKYRVKPAVVAGGHTFTGVTENNYMLSLLYRMGGSIFEPDPITNTFSIWCGADVPDDESVAIFGWFKYKWATTATVTQSGDAFQISYTIQHYNGSDVERFVNYNSNQFQGSPDSSNVYFYTIEAMTTADFGSVTIDPVGGLTEYDPINKTGNAFPADQYILWPNAIMTPEGTMVAGENFGDPYTLITKANGAYTTEDFQTNGDNYDTYRLVSLGELIAQNPYWQNGLGATLSKEDLHKKFTMQNALDFSISLKIPGIDNIQLDNGSVVAPVGPGGALANIPTGSIAFRINKTGTSKIRVIVSVPVSAYYDGYNADQIGAAECLLTDVDYYLGLWKTEDLNDDEWALNTFDMGSAEQKFELPRSRPYEPGTTTVGTADHIIVERDDEEYRCYLNGDSVLVGYEFTVTEPGTYIVGTTAGRWKLLDALFNTGNNIDNSYPMEIVYCSADGTASPGRDGTSTSAYGSIDYVYEHEGKIVHVQDYPGVTLPTKEDYQYYYSSHVITYTDNKLENGNTFVSINNLQVCVQRKIDTGQDSDGVATQHSAIYVNVKSPLAGEFTCKTAGVETDDIHVTYEGQRTDSTS